MATNRSTVPTAALDYIRRILTETGFRADRALPFAQVGESVYSSGLTLSAFLSTLTGKTDGVVKVKTTDQTETGRAGAISVDSLPVLDNVPGLPGRVRVMFFPFPERVDRFAQSAPKHAPARMNKAQTARRRNLSRTGKVRVDQTSTPELDRK
jgi:hypothetical protein